MFKELLGVVVLNGPMMIEVVSNEIVVTVYQHKTMIPYLPVDMPKTFDEIMGHSKKGLNMAIISDIYDVYKKTITVTNFSPSTVKEILAKLLAGSIQYMAAISVEEGLPILLVNSYKEKDRYLLSTIGLVDDARIIFAEIYENK
ncbi:hypothetical protein [Mariniplasma anaerobium]|uniref:Uncharacterized protein n=1 Tax=Mariniplasma anaerobium TaxID=2735436 RepID=A0A7U9XUS7_9MOLU|nr:hypothetical protein [Mariniplasma anaerobium]BCR35192.1 hypothetical protein MPAN_000850 [Mariniplasma anaerobium]